MKRLRCGIVLSALMLSAAGCTWFHRPDLRLLAAEVMKNTPEHLHVADDANFKWVLLDAGVTNNPPEFLQEAVRLLGQKYTVYAHDAVMSDKQVVRNAAGQIVSCEDGFLFGFRVNLVGWHTVDISYEDFEGDLAASCHTDRYRWTGKEWKLVRKGQLGLS